MFVLNISCHDLLGTNRPEGWVQTDRKWLRSVWAWVQIVWVRKIHGYETTGKHAELWSLANFRVPHSQSSARHAYINIFFTRIVVTGMTDFTEKQGLLLSSWELPCKITWSFSSQSHSFSETVYPTTWPNTRGKRVAEREHLNVMGPLCKCSSTPSFLTFFPSTF